jgi:hypothetical protein
VQSGDVGDWEMGTRNRAAARRALAGIGWGELKLGVEWVTNGRRDQRDAPRHATWVKGN